MGHNHNHSHEVKNYNNAFLIGVLLNILFVIAEVIYGITGDSLALIADAGHNLSDVLALLAAWGAIWLSKKQPTPKFTYGFKKSSVLAALFNAVILLVAIGGIMWEAIRRINHPVNVNSEYVIIVAAIGVVINGITAFLFLSGRKEDLNIRGAFLHMAADALMSLGVVVSGIVIFYTGFNLIDPIVSLIISCIILSSTWSLLKDSVSMAMDSVPKHINIKNVVDYLKSFKEIEEVHDIHIWNMSTSEVALTAHVVRRNIKNNDDFLQQLIKNLREKFGIFHITIQFENDKNFCNYRETCKISL